MKSKLALSRSGSRTTLSLRNPEKAGTHKENKASGGRKTVSFAREDVDFAEDKGQVKVKSSSI